MERFFRYFIYIGIYSFCSQCTLADGILMLDDSQGEYPLGKYVSVLEDKSQKLTINEITQSEYKDKYRSFTENAPSLG
ncbi:MAG: hypothetical protein OQK95_01715, partial [Gammaproteobacteria bacterium]|nr:hypothetical protein [Gammaproteobacteria bacterium]